MTSDRPPPRRSGVSGRTVQDYIDETPLWADATPVGHAPITQMQWLIWGLAHRGDKLLHAKMKSAAGYGHNPSTEAAAAPAASNGSALHHRRGLAAHGQGVRLGCNRTRCC